MRLVDALREIRQAAVRPGAPLRVLFGCGFTPLHLETFLTLHLLRRAPDRQIELVTGLFGDLVGTLERAYAAPTSATVAVVEWADLDPRLGLRALGGWGSAAVPSIVASVEQQLARLRQAVGRLAERHRVVLALPTLPLPPMGSTACGHASELERRVLALAAAFAGDAAGLDGVSLLSSQRLAKVSPPADRLDVRSDLAYGFPYTMGHAEVLAELLATLALPPEPRKALVTDLDDTVWRGILGEVGVDGVAWDLDHGAQHHGLYQQRLRALAEEGILVGVASKNERALVDEAFARPDLVLRAEHLAGTEVHWTPKSESVTRLLQRWNIGADAVVFVDDSAMELAEVKAAHPGVECLRFAPDDPQAVYALLEHLRDLFGRVQLSEEDTLRAASLRRATPVVTAAHDTESFLAGADATVTMSHSKQQVPARALELLNKTNQFNLNGRRWTEGEWREYLRREDSVILLAAYEDRFGPLGRVAVLAGRHTDSTIALDSWVMSCRAFARRLEYCCLDQLFRRTGAEAVRFDYVETPRNQPLRDCLTDLLGEQPRRGSELARSTFTTRAPRLYSTVRELSDG